MADVFVTVFGVDVAVAFEDAASVSVDDENRMGGGVEKDGIGSFGANAVNGEELSAECLRFGAEHSCERTAVFMAHKADEGFELSCFLAKVAGRANKFFEALCGDAFDGPRGQEFFAAEIADAGLDVGP